MIFSIIILFIIISITSITTYSYDTTTEISKIAVYLGEIGEKGLGECQFNEPHGLWIDGEGRLFVADSGNSRVQVLSGEGRFLFSLGGFGGEDGKFFYPIDVCVDSDMATYVLDSDKGVVFKFGPKGDYQGFFGGGGIDERLSRPLGIAIGRSGELIITDTERHRLRVYNRLTNNYTTIGGFGNSPGYFNRPSDCFVSTDGFVYIVDTGNRRIQRLSPSFVYTDMYGDSVGGILSSPISISINRDGFICVADPSLNKVLVFSKGFIPILTIDGEKAEGFNFPSGVAISDSGDIYISDTYNNRLLHYRIVSQPK
ncbi:MAG: NHL repeat-containing protein [bacterium]